MLLVHTRTTYITIFTSYRISRRNFKRAGITVVYLQAIAILGYVHLNYNNTLCSIYVWAATAGAISQERSEFRNPLYEQYYNNIYGHTRVYERNTTRF